MFPKLILLFFIISCSHTPEQKSPPKAEPTVTPKITSREFSPGELILGTELLTKIFDGEMGPLKCIPNTNEAELLLRTIRPRMEVVQDDMDAMMDNPTEVNNLIKNCDKNCTCGFVDELVREHLVNLTKAQRTSLNAKKSEKELNRCMNYVQTTFCNSELYKTLNLEKSEFTFEGEF
jgi:hypothetical protein